MLLLNFYFFSSVIEQGNQHKMLIKRSVAKEWLCTICVIMSIICKIKMSTLIYYLSVVVSYLLWFLFSLLTNGKHHFHALKDKCSLLIVSGKRINFVVWPECVFWLCKAQRIETDVGVRFLMTRAWQNTQWNFSLKSIRSRRSVWHVFWHLGKHLLIIRLYIYNQDHPWFVSYHVTPHLPRLVARERKKNKWFFFFLSDEKSFEADLWYIFVIYFEVNLYMPAATFYVNYNI